jgi:hypothetical protein
MHLQQEVQCYAAICLLQKERRPQEQVPISLTAAAKNAMTPEESAVAETQAV